MLKVPLAANVLTVGFLVRILKCMLRIAFPHVDLFLMDAISAVRNIRIKLEKAKKTIDMRKSAYGSTRTIEFRWSSVIC